MLGALGAEGFPQPTVTDKVTENCEYTEEQIDYGRFILSDVIPSFYKILSYVAVKAEIFSEIEPVVKKPNSENASVNYFIRYLSAHMMSQFKQPLHDAVATTASVVFDKEINSDNVRRIV
jgi:hypothetical protein